MEEDEEIIATFIDPLQVQEWIIEANLKLGSLLNIQLPEILQEPKNSLIKQYQELFKLEGVKLTFKENAIRKIADKAINKKTGARGLRSILENILLKTMFDLPGQENIEEVIIDIGAAKGQNDPIIVHSKNAKTKSQKTTAA